MKYEDFALLSAEEQEAIYVDQTAMDDMTAERDSFRTENEELRKQLAELKEENKKTKELNFTLARQVNVKPHKTAEDLLYDMFK